MVKAGHLQFFSRPVAPSECGDKGAHKYDAHSYGILCCNAIWGFKLKPRSKWYGKYKSFKFYIKERIDSEYASYKAMRRIMSGLGFYLEGALVSSKRSMQKTVALSVVEA